MFAGLEERYVPVIFDDHTVETVVDVRVRFLHSEASNFRNRLPGVVRAARQSREVDGPDERRRAGEHLCQRRGLGRKDSER
ncbi:hypothetical protein N806_04485 [Rhodococcus sp. P27]|nr:hypothetical protein N806_04485 [Rhodococcus sp. P27]